MATISHAQSESLDPPSDSIPAAAGSSQLTSTSTLGPTDVANDNTPPEHTQQQSAVTVVPNTSAEDGSDSAASAPPQQNNAEAVGLTTVSPGLPEEQKVATPASELLSKQSDASIHEQEDSGPSLTIVLLLITGSRHPFKIDGTYLRKHGANVENHDPFAMSVYTLKELIWRAWQEDWEPRPSSPSSIRLISFGKLLDDKAPLSDSKFSPDAPNVVHMTVKPQEIVDEEDAKGTKTQYPRDREASERSPRCRCVIQ